MPQTEIVFTGDALAQLFAVAVAFLFALYFTVKWAVAAALRQHRVAREPEPQPRSIDHYGG